MTKACTRKVMHFNRLHEGPKAAGGQIGNTGTFRAKPRRNNRNLQWSQVELATGRLHVRRAKNGSPSVHPMQGDEIRALRPLHREQGPSSHVFMTERDGPMTPKAFHTLFGRIGERAKMPYVAGAADCTERPQGMVKNKR